MANYLGKFLPHLASYTRLIKDLFSEKNEWCRGEPQKEAFQRLKSERSSTRLLASYSPATKTCVAADASVFSHHGIPEIVISDNGPQYSSEPFRVFSKEYGFTHITSSSGYPQANGEVERAVATVKRRWKGGEEKLQALMACRATPLECGYSPSQLLIGRQLRTTILQLPASLHPRWPNIKGFRMREELAKNATTTGVTELEPKQPLQPGQNIWLPREKKYGTVVQYAETSRSCIIHTDEGRIRRKREHLHTVHNPDIQTLPLEVLK
uniref:Integrase catalytic domain-containing protein n=1 Tax=Mola mola TaxID=94237 RepID=A0A3Q3W7X1_MOLML